MAVITGVQLISPALPALAERFALSESEVSLVISVYLIPATLASVPAGLLADRFGRRWVFGGGLCLFGVAGLLLPLVGQASFGALLVMRFLQGLGFAPAFPLTITILGDLYRGPVLVTAQGRRSVLMSIADGGYPILGGLLVGLSWLAPWYLQAVALPIGLLVLVAFRDWVPRGRPGYLGGLRWLWGSARMKGTLSLHYVGFLRFFVKFSLLAYLPLLLVVSRGMNAAQAGLILGAAALCGTLGAAVSGMLARVGPASRWVVLGLVVQGVTLAVMAFAGDVWTLMSVAVAYGLADGVLGTFINSYLAAATDPEHRASLVAANGAIKNLGKLLAPVLLGMVVLVAPLPLGFSAVAALLVISAPAAGPLRSYDARISN
jgi:MFS family permease